MMNIRILSVAVVTTLLFLHTPAHAGEVRLVSDTWDNIPVVEFCEGMNAPQRCVYSDTAYSVQRGYVYSGQDKVCYRRSSDPYYANSPLNQWTCATRLISGSYTYSIN